MVTVKFDVRVKFIKSLSAAGYDVIKQDGDLGAEQLEMRPPRCRAVNQTEKQK